MIDLTQLNIQAQIAAALIIIAFALIVIAFGKLEERKKK